MRQFTLSTPNGTLLGFLVLMADNDDETVSGNAMIQAHAAALPPEDAAPARALEALAGQLLVWQPHGDGIALYDADGGLAADMGVGIGVFIDEMQDLGPADVSALCAACHEISQQRLPLIVIGAGLPHLPALLSASKSYSERLFSYQNIDRLDRAEADKALQVPAQDEDADWGPDALAAMYEATGGYPYFIQAYGKAVWDVAASSPISADDVRVGTPEAEGELAVGFFGSRFERATPAERDYLRTMAELSTDDAEVSSSEVAARLGRKPQSLSPARDALMKKGLIYSGERGKIAFTVPHFGRYLRRQP